MNRYRLRAKREKEREIQGQLPEADELPYMCTKRLRWPGILTLLALDKVYK